MARLEKRATNRLTGAQLLVRALEAEGAELVFGYPGGAIMPVYDALVGSSLKHILVRHEQGAVFAAEGHARATGQVGVCLATSGPGATNLVTGIANAFADSVPLVAVTGQVNTALLGTDAFQEVDILGMTLPIVKHSWLVREAADIPAIIAEAFHVAASGRPGPVLIDLPKDVATQLVEQSRAQAPPLYHEPKACSEQDLAQSLELIERAKKPLLYVGGGAIIGNASPQLRELMRSAGLPAVSTLQGLGALDPHHPLNLGMLGMHGSKAANIAAHECDLLICCGARFDDRATGKLDAFAPNAAVIHMDVDAAEIGKLRDALPLPGQLAGTLAHFKLPLLAIEPWREKLMGLKRADAHNYQTKGRGVYAPRLLQQLARGAGDELIVTCDVGQHQMWVAQHCSFTVPRTHLTSGGLGAMGFGIPAGIGAKLAKPQSQVVTVTGDGSIMMNIQELATLKRYGVALKILLLDNCHLGMVRQQQELFYEENYSECDLGDNPDFASVAQAFGIEAFTLSDAAQENEAIERLLAAEGPCLLHVKIDARANVWPMVPPGRSNLEMLDGKAA